MILSQLCVLVVIGGLVVDWIGQIGALGEVMVVFLAYLDIIVFIFIGFCSFENIGSLYLCGAMWVMVTVLSNFEGRLIAAT